MRQELPDPREEALARFRELADSMPQIVWSVRADGVIEYFNKRWYERTKATRPDERNWRELLHPDDEERVAEAWRQAMSTEQPLDVEYRVRFPDDDEYRWFLARALPVRDGDGKIARWYGTSTDIDGQKRAEALLASKRHILEMIAAGAPLRETLEEIARLINLHWPHGIASVMLVDDEGRLHVGAAPGLPDAYLAAIEGEHIGSAAGSCGTAAFRREPVIVPDIATSDLWTTYKEFALTHGLRACWSVPVITRSGRLVGTIAVYYKEVRQPLPEEKDFAADSGASLAAIAIERELTERKLSEQARALDAANQNKDQFIAKLAHELRNPLGAIQAAMQVVKARTTTDSPLQRPHAVVERQTSHIVRLIDDLRDLSAIGRGEMHVRREPVDLRSVVEEAVETMRAAATQRGHQIEVQLPAKAVVVDGDSARLTQVFTNLITNSVKYTPHGGHISVSMRVEDGIVSTRVRDNGLGIPPQMLQKIFELYEQAEGIGDHAQGGMGIGLHLVRNLVTLHNGTVTAVSEGAGLGSEFEVRLPVLTAG